MHINVGRVLFSYKWRLYPRDAAEPQISQCVRPNVLFAYTLDRLWNACHLL